MDLRASTLLHAPMCYHPGGENSARAPTCRKAESLSSRAPYVTAPRWLRPSLHRARHQSQPRPCRRRRDRPRRGPLPRPDWRTLYRRRAEHLPFDNACRNRCFDGPSSAQVKAAARPDLPHHWGRGSGEGHWLDAIRGARWPSHGPPPQVLRQSQGMARVRLSGEALSGGTADPVVWFRAADYLP